MNESTVYVALEFDNKKGIVGVRQYETEANKSFKKTGQGAKKAGKEMKALNDPTSALITKMKSLGPYVAGAFSVVAIKRFSSAIITASSDLEEMNNKFRVVFKEQMAQAESWTRTLQDDYYMSERAAKQYLASVQDLLVPMGMNGDAAARLSNEIVKLSADLGSFNNMPTAQVMENIQSALTGEYESMKKYGIVINATIVQEKALAMGLAKTRGELTAGHKAQAAYTLMVESSQAAIGDTARSADSYATVSRDLTAALEDLSSTLGDKLKPAAAEVKGVLAETARDLNDWLSNSIPRQISDIEIMITQLQARAGGLGSGVLGAWSDTRDRAEIIRLQNELALLQEQTTSPLDPDARPRVLYGSNKPDSIPFQTSEDTYLGTMHTPRSIIETQRYRSGDNLDYDLAPDQSLPDDTYLGSMHTPRSILEQQRFASGGDNMESDAEKTFDALATMSLNTANKMEDNFSDFYFSIMEGEFESLADVGTAALKSLEQATSDVLGQMTRMAVFGESGTGGLIGKLFSSTPTPSARGNVFSRGQVVPFAKGGVVSQETVFPLGIMAEGGNDEAIMPLTRTASGDLGVKAAGAGATSSGDTYNVFQITALDTKSFFDYVSGNPEALVHALVDELDDNNRTLIDSIRRNC